MHVDQNEKLLNCIFVSQFENGQILLVKNKTKQIGTGTFLPVKSDSDVMFCLQSYQGLIIDRSLVYPQDRINTQVIDRFALPQMECTSKCLT